MKAKDLSCWKCGASLDGVPMPISRLSVCLACRAELHVCRLCESYDTRMAQACREPLADEVQDKTRANFCEHFYPRPGVCAIEKAPSRAPSAGLAALFGDTAEAEPSAPPLGKGEPEDRESARNPLDDLFRKE
jgi:hypothetical protein